MSGHPSAILVVAAVIRRDGRFLIGQRKRGGWGEWKWEFPGGKVEPGEPPREAVVRELREELGIAAAAGPELARHAFQYPGRPAIQLIFYLVTEFTGEPVNHEFEAIAWARADELSGYDFLDGDRDFVARLAQGEFSAPA